MKETRSRTLFISENAGKALEELLRVRGYKAKRFSGKEVVHPAISAHPDVFLCRMGARDDAEIITAPDGSLSENYPFDCAYNAACTGKYLICRKDVIAPEILRFAEEHGMVVIDVKQGYAKCSTVVVDEDHIITYDRGIARACARAGGPEVLLVEPGHVVLPGMDTGFIGGASGRVGNAVVFNGDLSLHPDFAAIKGYIEDCGLTCLWIPGEPLTDIGSIV